MLLALGSWFVERGGVEVRVASDPKEISEAFRLRLDHVERSAWEAGVLSDTAEERDQFDEGAIHLTAWEDDSLVGTARIILPKLGHRLPTEEEFGVDIPPAGKVVECGRWVVARSHRSRAHGVSMALSGLACSEVLTRGYRLWAGMTTPDIVELWKTLGFRMEVVASPRVILGVERVAVLCDLHKSLPTLVSTLGPLGAPVE